MSAAGAVRARRRPQELRGPSAYGGGRRRFVYLTWLIASTDFKLAYFGSALGYLWSLIRPLLTFGVLLFVFTRVFQAPGAGGPHYAELLLMNIVLYSFFLEATTGSVASVVTRENLVRKMHFPRLVIPLSVVVTSLMNLAANSVAVVVFFVTQGVEPRLTWLLAPLVVAPLALLATGLAMILSVLYVRFRDVAPIWGVVGQVLFYASPIFYSVEALHGTVGRLQLCNPIAPILEQARRWLVEPSAPGAVTSVGGWGWFLIPAGIVVFVCLFGLWLFERRAPSIAEEL